VAIPPKYANKLAYHFTHIRNLPGMIRDGLLSPNEQLRLGKRHKSIAIEDIQNRRAKMVVPCGTGGVVHDYVPFYFCTRSSMLLSVVNAKNVDQYNLIYLAAPVVLVERDDVVFTNASANTAVPPDFFSDPKDLDQLNWPNIESLKWSLGEAGNQARMAELLIHGRVELQQLDHLVVWNEQIKGRVEKIFAAAGVVPPAIRFDGPSPKHHYFTGFYEGSRASIVSGPYETEREYLGAVRNIIEKGPSSAGRYESTSALLDALRDNLNALPETNELIGLESENEVHKENVGDHTLSVVKTLVESEHFGVLDEDAKRTTELAAFLHDIGKGPKSRWATKGGKQQVDENHPIKSAKMLVRVLTEEARALDADEARILVKLACYHDLVGHILGKGRHAEQLEKIAESERELDMLIALGLADMRAAKPYWYFSHHAEVQPLRDRVVRHLKAR
jgi:hypothetical protein